MKRLNQPAPDSLLPFLRSTSLFKEFGDPVLREVAGRMSWFQLGDGQPLFIEGKLSTSLYLVFRGFLELYRESGQGPDTPLAKMGAGQSIGELAVLFGDRRDASCRAVGETIVGRFSRSDMVQVATARPEALDQLLEAVRRRLLEARLDEILRQNDLFTNLNEPARLDLGRELEWLAVPDDEILIRQGDPGDFLAVIVSGRFRVIVESSGGKSKIANELGPGDTIGEMSIITGSKRTATIQAIRDSEVVILSRDSFDRLAKKHPMEMMRTFSGGIINRLWEETRGKSRKDSTPSTISLIPASPEVPIGEFASRLVQAFSPLGHTAHISGEVVDRALQQVDICQEPLGGVHNSRLVTWLNAQEDRADFMLLEADSQATEWTARCLRQADLVLIVGRANDRPEPGPVEKQLINAEEPAVTSRQVLALIHEDATGAPSGTMAWLEARQVSGHHHVRRGMSLDYERLARSLAGRATGLVLSGGGARGAAHLGVLRALEELEFVVDRIGGNSAGAFMAAAYAFGIPAGEIGELVKQLYKPRNFFDPTLPLVSLFSRKRQVRFMRELFGERRIEDLWLPFYCVSSNLTRAELMVHESGLLRRWVLASNSAPGMSPPVVYQGDLLLDGALLDNLPVDVMRAQVGNGAVIGVDVSPPVDLAENPEIDLHLSGWRVLWSRVNPLSAPIKMPGIGAILQRASELSSKRDQIKLLGSQIADLIIIPPVEHFSLTDARALDEMERLGYEAAMAQIPVWQQEFARSGNGSIRA